MCHDKSTKLELKLYRSFLLRYRFTAGAARLCYKNGCIKLMADISAAQANKTVRKYAKGFQHWELAPDGPNQVTLVCENAEGDIVFVGRTFPVGKRKRPETRLYLIDGVLSTPEEI